MRIGELWTELGAELTSVLRDYRGRLSSLDITEKPDRTLLTEADLAVEAVITERIRRFEPGARIIAEESGNDARLPAGENAASSRVWVIDPIDGTSQFVRHDRTEFCSAVCLLEARTPVGALVVAPELGAGRTPLVLTATPADKAVTVNGTPADPGLKRPANKASVTRSAGSEPWPFETTMREAGYTLKTSTTSQTLDMVRTALDLSAVAPESPHFDLFFRRHQKVWDGLPGLCFGTSVGLAHADLTGHAAVPVSTETLAQAEPTFESTVMGLPEAVGWFLEIAQT